MTRPRTNLLAPFRRDRKRDFASGSGAELVRSKVLQVLMTDGDTPQTSGELPWRTAFGSGLHLLRHERNDEVLAQLARVRVRDALRRWLPELGPIRVDVSSKDNELIVRVHLEGEVVTASIDRSRLAGG